MADERIKTGGIRRKRAKGAAGAYGSKGFKSAGSNVEIIQRPVREVIRMMDGLHVFEELHGREREVIGGLAEVFRCPGGMVVFEPGDDGQWLYVVVQGRLQLRTRTGPGMHHAFREIEVGGCAGLSATMSQLDYHMKCVALEKTAGLRFRGEDLHDLASDGQTAGVKLYAGLCQELGKEIREATLEVVNMLERTSMMPSTDQRGFG